MGRGRSHTFNKGCPTLQVVLSSDFGLETRAGHVTLPGRFDFWREKLEDKTKTRDTLVTVQECWSFRQRVILPTMISQTLSLHDTKLEFPFSNSSSHLIFFVCDSTLGF